MSVSAPLLPETLEWSVWPARERPWAAAVLLVSLLVLGVLVAQATGDRVLGIAAPLIVLGSVGSFIAKTTYRLTKEAIEVRTLGVTRTRPWSEMRRATVDRGGVFLSPFEIPSWLEAYRGLRLPFRGNREQVLGLQLSFGGNRDQILAFVETKLPVVPGGGEAKGRGKSPRRGTGADA